MEVTMAEPQQLSSEPKSYTIIRVKRKLTADGASSDRFNSFKRLRHIGSFADKQSEETIAASNLLKQLGAVKDGTGELTPKRIKFNDLNSEQLEAYVERLDKKFKRSNSKSNTNNNNNNIENEKNVDTDLKKSTENNNNAVSTNDIQESSTIATTTINLEVEKTNDNNSIFDIELSPDDIGDSRVEDNETDSANQSATTITCNDSVLELVPSETNAERYVYDYYVLMDNLIDFEHNPDEKSTDCYYDEGEDADSNDENYRYNDYPDEDEFEDHSDEDYYDVEDKLSNYSEEDLIRDEDGNVLFVRGASLHHHRANSDDEDYFDESDDYADFCGTFDKLKFKSDYSDIDGGDDDSD